WDLGDGTQSSLRNPSHFYASNNNYKVCLTVTKAGCQAMKCGFVAVTKTTTGPSLTQLDELVQAYPNPADKELFVQSSFAINKVMIVDELGRMLYTVDAHGSQNLAIALDAFKPGVYSIKISGTQGTVHKKVFVLK